MKDEVTQTLAKSKTPKVFYAEVVNTGEMRPALPTFVEMINYLRAVGVCELIISFTDYIDATKAEVEIELNHFLKAFGEFNIWVEVVVGCQESYLVRMEAPDEEDEDCGHVD